MTTVILPRENEKTSPTFRRTCSRALQVQLVDHIDEVAQAALLPPDTPTRVSADDAGVELGPAVPDGMTH